MNKAQEYRRRANDCRAQAEKQNGGQYKDQWLALAEEWSRLAEQAEHYPNLFS